jgi:hypothetical protein
MHWMTEEPARWWAAAAAAGPALAKQCLQASAQLLAVGMLLYRGDLVVSIPFVVACGARFSNG